MYIGENRSPGGNLRCQSDPLYHMRNGIDRESNPRPQKWQALMLISNIDLNTITPLSDSPKGYPITPVASLPVAKRPTTPIFIFVGAP
jgi:hypothetical protein